MINTTFEVLRTLVSLVGNNVNIEVGIHNTTHLRIRATWENYYRATILLEPGERSDPEYEDIRIASIAERLRAYYMEVKYGSIYAGKCLRRCYECEHTAIYDLITAYLDTCPKCARYMFDVSTSLEDMVEFAEKTKAITNP
jgi:hypothetical protein